jgi:hypothetical protein
MAGNDTQEQLLTEVTTLAPTDFVRVIKNPSGVAPDSSNLQKSKFVDLLFNDSITPTLNGTTNDWAPAGITTAHFIRAFPTGPATLTGITTGAMGRVLFIQNAGSSILRFSYDDALSVSANRIKFPGSAGSLYVLQPDAVAILIYDSTLVRWRIVNASTYDDGWTVLGSFLTFVSSDGATTNVTTAADVTNKVQKGTRLKYFQNHNLTAYWNMDASSASQTGSFPGTDTAMTYTAGKYTNAATFNGTTSKIVIADNASLKPTSEFTFGCWIKSSTAAANQRVFQSFSANTNIAGVHITLMATTGALAMLIGKNTGTTVNVDYVQLTGTKNLCDGNWHYIVCTLRNNYAQIYADGALEAAGYSVAPAYAATNYVLIGMGSNTGVDAVPFNGQIDDVFFINGYAVDEQYIRSRSVASAAQGQFSFSLTKYAIITSVGVYDGSVTPLTFWGGTDFAGISGTMGTPYISTAKCPTGFNTNPDKWNVSYSRNTDVSQASPAAGTWYNLGGSVDVPIGLWRPSYSVCEEAQYNATSVNQLGMKATLSTANNTEDPSYSSFFTFVYPIANLISRATHSYRRPTAVNITVKTTMYMNLYVNLATTTLVAKGSATPTTILFEFAYL